MRLLVVYESMYGNTHEVASKVGEGLADGGDVEVVPVGEATAERLAEADLLVVGGPTHIHGLSTSWSRDMAVSDDTLEREAEKGHDVEVDPDAEGPGLRDWFNDLHLSHPVMAASFDTRFDAPAVFTGRASKGIRRRLEHHGCVVVAPPESFEVDQENRLLAGEPQRAVEWGRALLQHVAEHARRVHPDAAVAPGDAEDAVLDGIVESGGRFAPPL